MADDDASPKKEAAAPRRRSRAAPKKEAVSSDTPSTSSTTSRSSRDSDSETPPKGKAKSEPETRVPKRATLPPATAVHLRLRRVLDHRRPIFGRQAANRYWRIGRDLAWRRPRGLQSKQRRHYGYRAKIVRIGYGSPADVRGLTPSGYRPVIVHHVDELGAIDPKLEAAIIARTVGTRRRLGLEEAARKLGIRVLNPISTPPEE
ncbi:MAG: 50S ribosomal protein L32e [Thermoplasmata archaeon]|nr:50S ribosomal protein L32e [Thermoplasmata archaeon]